MFGPTGGSGWRGGRVRGPSSYSPRKRWSTHPGGTCRNRTNHIRNIDALGNPKKPYRPSAGTGCGLTLGIFLAIALAAKAVR